MSKPTRRSLTSGEPHISIFGEAALFVEAPGEISLEAQQRIWALGALAETWEGVTEVGLGMANLLIVHDPERRSARDLTAAVSAAWESLSPLELCGRVWEFPVVYGGERGGDLGDVAALLGVTPAEVAEMHAERDYVIFAPSVTPGYGYLYGLNPALVLPRKKVPIMLREAGTVSVGGVQTTIGMTPGPSGWYALGATKLSKHPFDPHRDPPLEVAVGDRIRFVIEDVLPC
jgi:KipI family sensor histidine kinase inhibitor